MPRIHKLVLAVAVCLPMLAVAADNEKSSEVRFLVVRESNGKPIRNAAVILHPVDKKGRQSRKGVELKTSPEGRTDYPGVPYGKVRVQVIAAGYQTFGEDFEIGEPQQEITIKLKKPQEQHSIYK